MTREQQIVWEEPPPKRGRRYLDPRKIAMLEHPGRWLLFTENGWTALASRLRRDGFDTTMRTLKGQRGRIYARWPKDREVPAEFLASRGEGGSGDR